MSASSSISLVRLVLHRIRWLRSVPHHGGVLTGGTIQPMALSARRSFADVDLCLVLVQGWWPDGGGFGILP